MNRAERSMQVGQLDLSNMNELESIDGNLQSEKIDSKMIEEEYKLKKRGRRQLILYSSFLFTADELSTTTTNDFRPQLVYVVADKSSGT